MAQNYGRNEVRRTGYGLKVSADGRPDWKAGGITLDTTTIAPVTVDTTLPVEQTLVKAGTSYLRYGQVLCKITASGLFGPFDPAATDGRQLLNPGDCYILDETWLDMPDVWSGTGTMHPAVFDGGLVWRDRLLQSGTAAASLAAGPTLAQVVAAFPRLSYVAN